MSQAIAIEEDILEALKSLGYSQNEARDALKQISNDTKGANARIKEKARTFLHELLSKTGLEIFASNNAGFEIYFLLWTLTPCVFNSFTQVNDIHAVATTWYYKVVSMFSNDILAV